MSKNVKVMLTGIKFITSDDSGTNMEVYGDLYARRVALNPDVGEFQEVERKHLWHRNGDNPQDIAPDNLLPIGSVGDLRIEQGEFLWLGGHIAEEDDWPDANDNLGFIDLKLSHDSIESGPKAVTFSDGGQKVEAKYVLTVL